jgi:hypothetical protein
LGSSIAAAAAETFRRKIKDAESWWQGDDVEVLQNLTDARRAAEAEAAVRSMCVPPRRIIAALLYLLSTTTRLLSNTCMTGSWLQRMLSSAPAPPLFCTEHPPPEPGNPLTRQDGERSKVLIRRLAPQILRHGPPSITDKKCRPSLYKFLKHTHTHTSGRCPPCTHRMIKSLRGALLKEKVFSPDPSFVFLFL